jgi:DNA-binding PadR family transcriptional regulator
VAACADAVDFIVSALELALLGLVSQAPRSGYDLRRIFAHTPFSHFSDSPGAIYPALRRLARKGWLMADSAQGGRRRRLFRLTAAGSRAWHARLGREPTRDDVIWRLDELMIRFAFMGEALPPGRAVRFLAAFERHARAHVEELRGYYAQHAANMSETGRLAFESGIESYLSRAEWAEHARARLEAGARGPQRKS